jgi:shikimate 5-dehydrogenase/shikimate kinase
MKWALIGHRGVGKTQLLSRLKIYLGDSNISFIDLDQEIEVESQTPIAELFPRIGEVAFRQLEMDIYKKVDSKNKSYILSVGAGFSLDALSSDVKIIWIRRKTDELGRIFLDRPRLNSNVSALLEFKERYSLRQKIYEAAATEVYWVPEGIRNSNRIEKQIWTTQNIAAEGILTLMPIHFRNQKWNCLRFQAEYYELRDDLVDLSEISWKQIPAEKRILSFRDSNKIQDTFKFITEAAESDWALELGPCPFPEISIISSHEKLPNETLSAFLQRLESAANKSQHLKAAPVIENLKQVLELLHWQKKDPTKRSILARSSTKDSGRWVWFRLYMKGRQKINFWRDSDGSSPDQPTLFEWLSTESKTEKFAALLGNPVVHSRTMVEQADFFSRIDSPVWPILVHEPEFSLDLDLLIGMGLRAAAVTSPLKKMAFNKCDDRSADALKLEAVNTLEITSEQKIYGHNTDLYGFKKQMELASRSLNLPVDQITSITWGGGGTLNVIQSVLPQSIQISVRSRHTRDEKKTIPNHVNVLIWAAGPEESFPPKFDFDLLVDLNYREDSKARELAMLHGKKYISGEEMFIWQAKAQRDFWKRFRT